MRETTIAKRTKQGAIKMNQLVTETETTKVLADPPPKPKQKTATAIVFFLVAAGALFIGIAAFGIYTRNLWTGAVQQRTNEAARMLVEVVHPEKCDWNDIPPVTGSDDALHGRTHLCPDQRLPQEVVF
jgi:hypothetical protein